MAKPNVNDGWTLIDTTQEAGDTLILWGKDGEAKVTRIEGEWEYDSLAAALGQPL